jgi:hypothetical protein
VTPWWVLVGGPAIAALIGWGATAWAKRGNAPDTLNNMAMGMVKQLSAQLDRTEAKVDWRVEAHERDRDHIDVLEHHIWQELGPPPPSRPIHPPRPA